MITEFGEDDDKVVVEHAEDWSGIATLRWQENGRNREASVPGRIIQIIVDTVAAETMFACVQRIMHEADRKLDSAITSLDQLNDQIDKAGR